MSVDNWQSFINVNMFRDASDPTANNMEYLFYMTNPNAGGYNSSSNSDPLSNSLFNLTTLKTLVKLGMNTPNIVGADKDKVFGQDFNLNDWADIAKTLELNDSDEGDGLVIGKKRAYLIWLWLYTAKEWSF